MNQHSPTKGAYLEHLTWEEAAWALQVYPIVLLPVGARTKEHGLHLPLNTDWLQAEYLTHQVVERRPVLALPTVPYGYYPAFVEYPGSVSLSLEVFRDTISEICRSTARHGATRFYVLNTGISTNWALEPVRLALAGTGILMEYTDLTHIHDGVELAVAEQAEGSHADELETSVLLHIAPETVCMERARPDMHPAKGRGPFTRDPQATQGRYSPTGAWGDPSLASAQKGSILTSALIDCLLAEIDALRDEAYRPAPARHRYLSR